MLPDFQALLLPILRVLPENGMVFRDVHERLAQEFSLSEDEKSRMLPSGNSRVFENRIRWAIFHLKKAGLLITPQRGLYAITQDGRQLVATASGNNDVQSVIASSAIALSVQSGSGHAARAALPTEGETIQGKRLTPHESIYQSWADIKTALVTELIHRIRSLPPSFFEEVLIKLLLAMGYGGLSERQGRTLGQSGDDGVDGVINQDLLGVDPLYIQAKRYAEDNKVGAAAIRDFYGALSLKKTQKGIFITTSSFTDNAIKTAQDFDKRIILIDGAQLGSLMFQYNIGCRDEGILYLKKIDEDFFA